MSLRSGRRAAARYLDADGAPDDYRAALFAYNHADWYVAAVLAKANQYRGAPAASGPPPSSASVREILASARIVLTPIQRSDLRSGLIDPRLIATLAWIGRRHTVVITALRSDHRPGTNHAAGRAIDIGAVTAAPAPAHAPSWCANSPQSKARCARPS